MDWGNAVSKEALGLQRKAQGYLLLCEQIRLMAALWKQGCQQQRMGMVGFEPNTHS